MEALVELNQEGFCVLHICFKIRILHFIELHSGSKQVDMLISSPHQPLISSTLENVLFVEGFVLILIPSDVYFFVGFCSTRWSLLCNIWDRRLVYSIY